MGVQKCPQQLAISLGLLPDAHVVQIPNLGMFHVTVTCPVKTQNKNHQQQQIIDLWQQ
jgi:hypothetical protein